MEEIEELRERVRLLEEENARLRGSKQENCNKESGDNCEEKNSVESTVADDCCTASVHRSSTTNASFEGSLEPEQIERYSRQLLLHQGFGVEGQLKLLNSSVLVVGAGGIGSTGTALNYRDFFSFQTSLSRSAY